MRRRNYLRATGLVGLSLVAGCTGSEDTGAAAEVTDTPTTEPQDQTDETTTTETETSTPKSKQASVKLGEPVEGSNLALVARKVSRTDSLGEFMTPKSGNEYLVLRLAVKNMSDQFADFSSFWQARLKDASNHVYNATFGSVKYPIESGILAPREVARGDVVFEIPKDASGLVLQFDFSAFDFFEFDRVEINLDSKADSIADPKQNLSNVHSLGKSVSHNDVSVVVHGVRTKSKLGSFTKADEGHEFVILDIEITNNTGEPLTVSTALQMRVKNGTGLAYTADLMATSQLSKKYAEGSDIGPGGSRRGELSYQVKKDEKPLYWAFDFLDLGEPMKAFWKLR